MKGFYHIWAWRPSWSCDLEHLYKLSFPLPKEANKRYYMSHVMRKPAFCICENKDTDQLRSYCISAFVFTTQIVEFLFFLNLKFPAYNHLLWLYSPVCVGPIRKPKDRFSHVVAHINNEVSNADLIRLGISTG